MTGCIQNLPGKVTFGAVVLTEDGKLKRHRVCAVSSNVGQRDDITQGFAHFAAVDLEVVIMQPNTGELLAGQAFGLGDFVAMVDRDMVDAAGVDVNLVP